MSKELIKLREEIEEAHDCIAKVNKLLQKLHKELLVMEEKK
jgi:hypothetical protein